MVYVILFECVKAEIRLYNVLHAGSYYVIYYFLINNSFLTFFLQCREFLDHHCIITTQPPPSTVVCDWWSNKVEGITEKIKNSTVGCRHNSMLYYLLLSCCSVVETAILSTMISQLYVLYHVCHL